MQPHIPVPSWSAWLSASAELIWPRFCLICADRVSVKTPPGSICDACRTTILTDPHPTCPRCSSTVGPFSDLTSGCLRCRNSKLRFVGAVRLGPYDGRLREAILRIKTADGEPLAETLGELWAETRRTDLLTDAPQVVVPISLHWRRRWSRGYNQSEAVARGVTNVLGLPLRSRVLERTRPTPTQTAQSPTQRWENVRSAFRVKSAADVQGLSVLLIDDVMTTGATADAATAALLQAGAAQVRLGILAHR